MACAKARDQIHVNEAALIGQDTDGAEKARLALGAGRSKSAALAMIVRQPSVLKSIGSAWPLYLRLMLDWEGSVTGTRDEIGEKLGEDGRNVGNWINGLAEGGIVTVEKAGRRMKVSLTGMHMHAARMSDIVTVLKRVEVPDPVLDDRQKDILGLVDRARALGGEAEVRIVVKTA